MLHITNSGWKFVGIQSAGAGVLDYSAERGAISFRNPDDLPVSFQYWAVGAGPSLKERAPQSRKLKLNILGYDVSLGVPSPIGHDMGVLYCLDHTCGNQLWRSDLAGFCTFIEIDAGVGSYASLYAMLLGVQTEDIARSLGSSPVFAPFLILRATKALLLIDSISFGIQAGAGIAGYVGRLS